MVFVLSGRTGTQSERFDLEGVPDTQILPTRDEYRTMAQKTLVERLGLKFHAGRKMITAYVLSVDKGGLKIQETVGQPYAAEGWGVSLGRLQVKNTSFAGVARVMQRMIFDRPVVDEAGLKGRYTLNSAGSGRDAVRSGASARVHR